MHSMNGSCIISFIFPWVLLRGFDDTSDILHIMHYIELQKSHEVGQPSLPLPTIHSIMSTCSLAGAVELVPHLPSRLGLRRHPHPHAGHQDGRSLQARIRPAQWLPGLASACLVHDRHVAQASLLPDAVRQAGEAGRRQAVFRLHPPVDHAAGRAGGAGPEHFSREAGSVRPRGVHSAPELKPSWRTDKEIMKTLWFVFER